MSFRKASLFVLLGVFGVPPIRCEPEQRVNEDARVLKEFSDHVAAYAALRAAEEAKLPKLDSSSTSERITEHQKLLADRIRAARRDARRGNIFDDAIALRIRRFLAADFAGKEGSRVRSAIFEEMPPRVFLVVNDPYPGGGPVSNIPPRILRDLPPLPEDLEYRFMGRHLILRDARANLIVDFIMRIVR
jgi:hypothetical protein